MRNLKLLHSVRVGDAFELANTQQICIDYDTKVVYCATSTGVYGLDPSSQQIVSQISLVEEGYGSPPGGSDVVIVGVEHLPDQMSVCVATGGGDVLLWNTTNNQLECVGSVEHGLTAMCWSTDQELVVLATGQNTLIMTTREFEPVTEVTMFSDQFGEAEFINVGWGKKETQFHGSEGKAAAFAKKPEAVSPAADWDDKKARICWHSDGQYFVVSAIEPDTGCRRLRVWTRDCRLYSTSETVDGLEQALGWKSTGNLITTSQHRPNRHDIVFFERNGLRHGEFTLPFGVHQVKVLEVNWNRDSTILAVWLEELPPDESTSFVPHSFVQLWTVGNYHWYLKQSLKFSATSADRISALCWDQEHANRLHVVCKSGQYLQYTWSWTTDNSPVMTGEQSNAITAVVDGGNVLVTPFHQMVVPPPMCAYKLCLSSPVSQITFAPPSCYSELAVLTDCNQVAVYSFDKDIKSSGDSHVKVEAAGGNGFSVQCDLPVFKGLYRIVDDPINVSYPLKFYHVTWCRRDLMLFFTLNIMGTETEIHHGRIDHETGEIKICHTSSLSGYVYNTALNTQTSILVLEMTGGQILQYNPDDYSITPWLTPSGRELMYSPSKLCTQLYMCTVGGQEVVLGLTDQYQFCVNDIPIATNCTSFAIHDEFLLFTTYAHTCRCINRKTALNALSGLADDKTHTFDESVRRVERGSRIVTVVGGDTRLILQMPRGNLETIHPRALVLCAVRKHLDRLEFKKAFVLMRKHRINMNLIHDHNPELFLSNVDRFIHQVETPSWINLFITDLQEEDVTKTMYTAAYVDDLPVVPPTEEPDRSSKIDRICDRLKEGLERIDADKYLLSILTAHVKKSTPELDTALKKIKDLKSQNVQGSVSAEDALNYLLFLVDVNEMYDVALGMYDFELVLMVAEKSQKDPKEYIAYLNTLRKMEENYQRYTIDKHLKRYTSALKHIIKCGDSHFLECLQLVKEQRLYREAMLYYTPGGKEYKEIALAYGEFLLEKQHPEEAGLFFSKAECWRSAVEAFKESLNWQLALCMAYKAGYDHTQLEQLCRQLVTSLKDQSRYKEAAVIIEQHLDDLEEAIVTLIDGAQWEEALRLMYKTRRTDFIETHLNDALIQSYTQFLTLFDSVCVEFQRHKTRLAVVRAKKERDRLEFLEGTTDHNVADADLFSDTSSATGESITSRQSTISSNRSTIFSKRSGKSAKTRRKHERKKWSLKEGSPYEDVALVEALSKICKQTEEWKGEVSSLLRMLMLFNHVDAAAKLQEQFESLNDLVLKSLDDIWPEDADNKGTEIPNFGPDSTANVIVEAMRQGCRIETETKLDRSMMMRPDVSKDNKWKLHSAVMLNR